MSLQAEFKNWTKTEQDLFKDFIALNLLDAHMTYKTIQDFDAVEINPILGKDPSLEKLILHKTLSTVGIYYLLDKDTNTRRKRDLKILNTVYMGVVLHNGYVIFDIKKKF
tara:strand:- start:167 stop:496 length:330 start_codon:yes stop_codon:yes gene_type:complete